MTTEIEPTTNLTPLTVVSMKSKLQILEEFFTASGSAETPSEDSDSILDFLSADDAVTITKKSAPKKAAPQSTDKMTVADAYGLSPIVSDKQTFICGIEYELECVLNPDVANNISGLHVTTDGSLKYLGYEFIASPGGVDTQLTRYTELFKKLKFEQHPSITPFNERTSTHVHVNVQLLNIEELRTLLYLYILVEEALFRQAKPYRRHNIHCVPLRFTCLGTAVGKLTTFSGLLSSWHKYSALNLLPMKKLGTVEFRHMHGMDSYDDLHNWLRNLEALYLASVSGVTTKDIIKALYSKQSITSIVNQFIPKFNLNGTPEAALGLSSILLKQAVVGSL